MCESFPYSYTVWISLYDLYIMYYSIIQEVQRSLQYESNYRITTLRAVGLDKLWYIQGVQINLTTERRNKYRI